jgi:hypothetical protein
MSQAFNGATGHQLIICAAFRAALHAALYTMLSAAQGFATQGTSRCSKQRFALCSKQCFAQHFAQCEAPRGTS